MTTFELYRKHKKGEVSREKFLYEVRRDNNLPWITNLTSYNDAVAILKHKGIITDENPAIVAIPAVGLMTEGKKEVKEVSIDIANPYEYRHGLQFELETMNDYSDEALNKAKSIVLKNLAKNVNYYSNLLNQDKSPYKFPTSETDKKGMQAKADGYLKKEAKKDEKANVQDTLGKKEAGKKKPKGIKIMPDKGVTGSEKTIKEGLEEDKFYAPNYVAKKFGDKAKDIEANIHDEEDSNPNIWDLYTSLESPEAVDDFVKGFVDENIFNTAQMGGVTTSKGTAGYIDSPSSSPEDEFNQLMSKYDWYYEMSDDPRVYDRGLDLDKQLKVLGKQIGADKAVAMFNAKAPSDRKVTSTFFTEGEDKHAKIKEILKAKVKEAIFKKSATGGKEDVVVASSPRSTSELTKRGYTKIPGTEDATGLKS